MGSQPQKRTGFRQGIYDISSTPKEQVGTLRVLRDGRKYRYAQAGAAALSVAKLNMAPASATQVINEACASDHAIGDYIIQETITAGLVHAEDYYAGGFFQITDGTGEGHMYEIESSSAVAIAGTTIILSLANPIREALVTTTTQFSLILPPQKYVIESATEENCPAGIAPLAVTALYYFWDQTGGVATVLGSDTAAVGTVVVGGAAAGSVKAIPTALDADMNYQVGIVYGTAMVDGEYTQIFMTLD